MTKSKGRLDASREIQNRLFAAIAEHLEQAGPSDTETLSTLLGESEVTAKEVLRWARRVGDVVCIGRGPWARWCLPKDQDAYRSALALKLAAKRKANHLAHRQRKDAEESFRHRVVPASRVKLRLHPMAVRSVFDLAEAA